jgi:hypothetical protein
MKKKYEQHGLGFVEALGLLFIAMKLTGVITWSWLWVLAPLWGQLVFFVLFLIGYAIWRRWN